MKSLNQSNKILTIIFSSAIITFIIGVFALVGSVLDVAILTRGAENYSLISPNTAICFMLSGASLFLIAYSNSRKAVSASKILSAIIILFGITTLTDQILNINLDIDVWLFPNAFIHDPNALGKMAGVTALNFILIGIALLFSRTKSSDNRYLIFIAFPFIDALVALTGYIYDVSSLYSLGNYYKLSFYTATAFLICCTGLLFLYEDTFIVKLFRSSSTGGILLRRFTPFLVLLLIVMRVLTVWGNLSGLYSADFGDALEIVGNIIILTSFIFWNANKLNKLDENLKSSVKQNQLLASIVQSTTDAVISKTLNGVITSWNEGSEKLFGYNGDEIIGKSINILIPPEKMEEYDRIMEKVKNGKYVSFHETIRKKKNGDIIDVSVNVSPIKDAEGKVIGASSIERDITEQKIAQERLSHYAESLQIQNRLMRIIASSLETDDIFDSFISELGKKIKFDRSSILLFNDAKDKYLIERMWSSYEPIIAEKQWRNVKNSAVEIVINECKPFIEDILGSMGEFDETPELRKEGINSRAVFPLKIQDEVIGCFAQGSKMQNAFDNDDFELLTSLSDFLSVAVQNSKLYEKIKKMNEELEHRVLARTWELNEVNKELEAFAYSVSHDLKAPLRAINGFAKVLIEDYKGRLNKDALRVLHIIIDNSQKMSNLINDLLTFSRTSRSAVNLVKLNMKDIIYSALAQLCSYTDEEDFDINIQDEILPAVGDKNMIQLVFVNLLSNAFKFISTNDKPRVEIGSYEKNNENIYFVKDNGVGFNMKFYDKLFGVFQRLHTEDEFEGTGVGLALVQKIIQKHGGKVWAESELNKGTVFYFSLKKERETSDELQ